MALNYTGLPSIAEKVLAVLEARGPLTIKRLSDAVREHNSGYRIHTDALNRVLREYLKGKVACVGKQWGIVTRD